MLDRTKARRRLLRLFNRKPIADINILKRVLDTSSRTTVFRILSEVGYLTSYSHAGRYYTLNDVPSFDTVGLWRHGEVLFSRQRTLRATVLEFVNTAPAGQTHAELEARVRLRVHDTLLDLVQTEQIGRVALENFYLYVSAKHRKAHSQVSRRRQSLQAQPVATLAPEASVVIEVLLAFIHQPRDDPASLGAFFQKKGKAISREEIEAVFARYGLGKKKRPRGARSRERRTPPSRG